MKNKVGFLITAYDQLKEVLFTVKMLRKTWKQTATAPIVVVISGDTDRNLGFPDDPYTRVIHLNDMVGEYFKVLVSTSIMKQIEHGMIEMKDLERQHGPIENVVHMHGDILLLGEKGFFDQLDRWKKTNKPVAADPVSASGPWKLKNLCDLGKTYDLAFYGCELMPQLFAVDHDFCKHTGFMYDMSVVGDLEIKATEWALIGNLHRATFDHFSSSSAPLYPRIDVYDNTVCGPYFQTFNENVYAVKQNRQQWGLHNHWGGFTHFGNSIHVSQQERERKNLMVLRQYGLDLSEWK